MGNRIITKAIIYQKIMSGRFKGNKIGETVLKWYILEKNAFIHTNVLPSLLFFNTETKFEKYTKSNCAF